VGLVAAEVQGSGFGILIAITGCMDSGIIAISMVHWGVLLPCTVNCKVMLGGLGQVRGVARLGCQGLSLVGGHCCGCHSVWWNVGDLYHWHWCWHGLEVVGNKSAYCCHMLTSIARLYCGGRRTLEIVGWGCAVVLWLGFGVVVIVALLLLSVVSSMAVLAAVATCTKVSKRAFGAMELLSSVMFVIVV